jgi:glycosyltransferase involved in cell wall biosynthesis
MKALLISYLFHPYTAGGAERVVLDLARGLSREGCRVLVMTAGRTEERYELQPGISVWRIFHRSPYFNDPAQRKKNRLLQAAWRLLACWNPLIFGKTVAVLRSFRPDIIHVHNFHGFSPALFAAARRLSIPVVFTPHDYFPICRRYNFFKNGQSCQDRCFGCRLWSRWSRSRMGRFHLLSLTRFSRELFLRYLRPASDQLLYLASPMNSQEIRTAAAQKQRLAAKKKTVFLFMGRLNEFKGIRWLLDSLRGELPPRTLFLIAGDGPLRALTEEFCRRHPAHCKFLGEVSGASKHKLLLATDVLFCLSVGGDMSPLVIPEAFGYGIPVIGTAAGAIAEWITPAETGWLVAHGSRENLAAVVAEIGARRALLKGYSGNCFRKAAANNSELHARAVLDRYRELSRRSPGNS